MDHLGNGSDAYGFDMPSNLMSQPPQIFGAYNPDGSPAQAALSGSIFGDNEAGSMDENDPKRRRIARVRREPPRKSKACGLTIVLGVRHVPEEEDKVR